MNYKQSLRSNDLELRIKKQIQKILHSKFCIQNSYGFTLVETVIASAVALVVGTLLVSILVNHSGLFYKESSIVSEGLGLNDVMAEIKSNVRESIQVSAGYPESSPTYLSSTDTIVLKLPSISSSGTIDNVYDYIIVAKDPTNQKILRLQLYPDAQSIRRAGNTVLTTLLDSIEFGYLNKSGDTVEPDLATSVLVNIKMLSRTGSVGSSRTSTSTTALRNFRQ